MIPLLSSQDTIKMEFPRPLTRQETDPDLPRVSRSLWWRCESKVACHGVRGTDCNIPGSHDILAQVLFEGG